MASSSTDLKPESSTSPEQDPVSGFQTVRSLILCGASVRSLAQSAISAGLRPLCVDFFEDEDLTHLLKSDRGRFVGRIRTFEELPSAISGIRRTIPLLWAGGLENHSDVIRAINTQRPVIGPDPSAVEALRQPQNLVNWLTDAGLKTPRLAFSGNASADCSWLRKPRAGSGGLGIRSMSLRSNDSHQSANFPGPTEYLQEYIDGVPMSAIFCSNHRGLKLVGTSLQLIGWPGLGASDFLFCGNVGPVNPGESVNGQLMQAAQSIVHHTGLRGVFGIDFILRGGEAWFIEVNPRLTASHMLYDDAEHKGTGDGCLVLRHLAAYGWAPRSNPARKTSRFARKPATIQARLILWASEDVRFTNVLKDARGEFWTIADTPQPGTVTPAGSPICSIHIMADSNAELLQRIQNLNGSRKPGLTFSWPDISRQLGMLFDRYQRNCQRSPKTSDQTISS